MPNGVITRDLGEEIDLLVNMGYYPNKKEVVKDAMRCLLQDRGDLRLNMAIILYSTKKVSLGKAAGIAGVGTVEFKEVLGRRGITREVGSRSVQALKKRVSNLKKKI